MEYEKKIHVHDEEVQSVQKLSVILICNMRGRQPCPRTDQSNMFQDDHKGQSPHTAFDGHCEDVRGTNLINRYTVSIAVAKKRRTLVWATHDDVIYLRHIYLFSLRRSIFQQE